jgi:hypothetical protein
MGSEFLGLIDCNPVVAAQTFNLWTATITERSLDLRTWTGVVTKTSSTIAWALATSLVAQGASLDALLVAAAPLAAVKFDMHMIVRFSLGSEFWVVE